MNTKFTKKATEVLDSSLSFAREMGHTYIGTEHILLGLLSCKDSIAYRVLSDRGIELAAVKSILTAAVGTGTKTHISARDMTPKTKKIIEESAYTALRLGHSKIGTEHILSAIVSEKECYANKLIKSAHGSIADIINDLSKSFGSPVSPDSSQKKGSRRENEAIPCCPILSRFGTDLCRLSAEGRIDPIIGREAETDRVIQILSRRQKNNPCLIGEAGVGKTAVVEGLAVKITEGKVPCNLREKTVVTLDISSMVAGAKYRGEFEERMKGVMDEVSKNKNIILFVDEIHTIIGAGGAEGAVDAANIIKPALARGQMQLIGATTSEEYRKYIEKDPALERRFQSVFVGEPTPDEAIEILRGLKSGYEEHHLVKISDSAVVAAVKLSHRYIGDRFLPDKAIDLLDEAAAMLSIGGHMPTEEEISLEKDIKEAKCGKEEAILNEDFEKAAFFREKEKTLSEKLTAIRENKKEDLKKEVLPSHIEDILTVWTKIPVKKLEGEEKTKLLNLDKELKSTVIGQDSAVDSVVRAIRRGRAGLKDPSRPVGSFLFLGPTGVGKTLLSKALANSLFGDGRYLIRFDMSEYMERHSISKLIGAPPGYIGHDDGGQLTKRLRQNPYCVVLFDEIEKAHPDIYNILLQILDDGAVTDSTGRQVSLKNAVIIMTSNTGTQGSGDTRPAGFLTENEDALLDSAIQNELKKTFRPELISRIDEIIVFKKLSESDLERIAASMLDDLKIKIGEMDIDISFEESIAKELSKIAFAQKSGARPLKRAVVRSVEDKLCKSLLEGELSKGDQVTGKMKDGEIVFEKNIPSS